MASHFLAPVLAAIGCAAVLGTAASAAAQPPPPAPPTCSSADLAGTMTGVMAATSAYLYTHPPVNDFFTSLKGQPPEARRAALQTYMDANPQVRAELQAIRQPMVDFRKRCGG
ncbi:heme-binding protein [Mycobacterium sp. 4D054]|uniref:heme-binding protein n=1 Tax=unclassified Mycobacterium TaxID=2642494 RepID=UPI0021B1B716|nr:heme-binding protein [Mycobacterium sp. SMC-8]UXA14907.1 heme-binding protein [Mycobacterium sp. SMC-8]